MELTDGYNKTMKKIIKGKVYNTETSEVICKIPGNQNEAKTLYRKKGTISFYTVIDRWGIVDPVSWAEARELIYKYGTRKKYCELFSLYDPYGDPKKQRTNLDMDKQTYAMLRILAGENNSSVKGYMRKMIHDRYRAYEKKQKQRGTTLH